MSPEFKSRIAPNVFILAILVLLVALVGIPRFLFAPYDSLRLSWFSHRIAGTDRIVATNWVNSVSLTLTGDDARKVVRAISSAGSGRPPSGMDWANMYTVNAKLYRGTRLLGEIEMDGGGLFLIHYHKPPFQEGAGLLHDLIYKPLSEAAHKAEETRLESQIQGKQ
jgi:hypothetical protein